MQSFTFLIAIVSAILIIILVAYGLVIFGLRDVFFSGQDIGSRLATYVRSRMKQPKARMAKDAGAG